MNTTDEAETWTHFTNSTFCINIVTLLPHIKSTILQLSNYLSWFPLKAKKSSLLCYLTHIWAERRLIQSFPKDNCIKMNGTDKARIWSQLAHLTSCMNIHYTTYTAQDYHSSKMYFHNIIFFLSLNSSQSALAVCHPRLKCSTLSIAGKREELDPCHFFKDISEKANNTWSWNLKVDLVPNSPRFSEQEVYLLFSVYLWVYGCF